MQSYFAIPQKAPHKPNKREDIINELSHFLLFPLLKYYFRVFSFVRSSSVPFLRGLWAHSTNKYYPQMAITLFSPASMWTRVSEPKVLTGQSSTWRQMRWWWDWCASGANRANVKTLACNLNIRLWCWLEGSAFLLWV